MRKVWKSKLAKSTQKLKNPTLDDLPEPKIKADVSNGGYYFEHGCADYLRTADCHPHMHAQVVTERATRFWAEFFGVLEIGFSFLVIFLLQLYRFLLYSLVNTLLVGFIQMTSDYLIKPLLTVIFNGFLQPPLIFIFNVLASVRDVLEPVAEIANNFLKPVGNVLKNVRLVDATTNNNCKFAENV